MTPHLPVIASVSGGKDSAAMCLHFKEIGVPYEAVFCDTGWEHDDTYAYLCDELPKAIGPIQWLTREKGTMADLVRQKAMFPSRTRRFCTEELKVFPIRAHLESLIEAMPGVDVESDEVRSFVAAFEAMGVSIVNVERMRLVNAIGIRAAESQSRGQMPEWEHWGADGTLRIPVLVWRPLIRWTEQDVIDIHRRHGLRPNPLYLRGASRVGCWPCIYARKSEIAMVAKESPERIDLIETLETDLSALAVARAAVRARSPWPVELYFQHGADGMICHAPDPEVVEREHQLRDVTHWRNQRTYFGVGDKSRGWEFYGIRQTVEWAKTDRGGRQYRLFEQDGARDGCMRWGMCETDPPEAA